MAWIVKPSATQTIEHRAQPYLTDEMKHHLSDTVLPRYTTRRAATLPVLHYIQHHYNYIPHQAIEEAADFLDLTPAQVLDTASFYEEFHLHPKGKYLIQICQSISCELCGHTAILDKLKAKLHIQPGETTPDGKFTLETVECLGSCGTAPAALVHEKLHENLTWDNLQQTLDQLPD